MASPSLHRDRHERGDRRLSARPAARPRSGAPRADRVTRRAKSPPAWMPSAALLHSGSDVRVRVLGSAAGGGFPQWNCGCANCGGVRDGVPRAASRAPRTRSRSAPTASVGSVLNASPDVRAQIEAVRRVAAARAARLVRSRASCSPTAISITCSASSPCASRSRCDLRDRRRAARLARAQRRSAARSTASTANSRGTRSTRASRAAARSPTDSRPGCPSRPFAAPGKLPVHLEGLVAATPRTTWRCLIRDRARRAHHWSTHLRVAASDAVARRGATRRGLRAVRWHVLVERRARAARPRTSARREDMAHWPDRRRRRKPRVPRVAAERTRSSTPTSTTRTRSCSSSIRTSGRAVERAGWRASRSTGWSSSHDDAACCSHATRFSTRLRARASTRYHDRHPFHIAHARRAR